MASKGTSWASYFALTARMRDDRRRPSDLTKNSVWTHAVRLDGGQFSRYVFPCDSGIVVGVHVHEEHVTQAQRAREPQRCIGADSSLAVHGFVDAARWSVDRLRFPELRDARRLEELLQALGVGKKAADISPNRLLPTSSSAELTGFEPATT
jgi:hypothetical protein